jgi:uncharacterized repeat protein (TIGR03803 family)
MRLRFTFFGLAILLSGSSAVAAPAVSDAAHSARAHQARYVRMAPYAGALSPLYAFHGQPDGAVPESGVLIDGAGNIFGNTGSGGANNNGSIYELSPVGSTYAEHIVLSYSAATDGDQPVGTLESDQHGKLFGTAPYGGHSNDGTAIELTPAGGGAYRESAVHSFMATDGALPFGGMVRNGSTFYATTGYGGLYNSGTVISLNGPRLRSTVLYSFGKNAGDGQYPNSRLAMDARGSYYGTTASTPGGTGAVFKFAPSASGGVSTLFTFHGTNDGVTPKGVTLDASGNLYGTTNQGGANGVGLIYKLTPGSSGYTEHILHVFKGANGDGRFPNGTLLLKGKTLYGTTTSGGSAACGTIFKIATSGRGYSVVYPFQCGLDGGAPMGDLLWAQGAIYGVASAGGAGNNGVVYKFVP